MQKLLRQDVRSSLLPLLKVDTVIDALPTQLDGA